MNYLLVHLLIFFITTTQHNNAFAFSVKHENAAAEGCLSRISFTEAEEIFSEFNFTTRNATRDEVIALGTGLRWIKEINSGRALDEAIYRGIEPYPFIFRDAGKNSRQTIDGIIIARKGEHKFGENIAQLIHELGHLVGHQGGYNAYRAFVGNNICVVSGYSNDSFNEQFAEVFAAFITDPGLIKNNNSYGCKIAWEFFTNKLFSDSEKALACLKGPIDQIAAADQSSPISQSSTKNTVSTTRRSSPNIKPSKKNQNQIIAEHKNNTQKKLTLAKRVLFHSENPTLEESPNSIDTPLDDSTQNDFCDSQEPWIIKKCSHLAKRPPG